MKATGIKTVDNRGNTLYKTISYNRDPLKLAKEGTVAKRSKALQLRGTERKPKDHWFASQPG